VLLLFVTHDFYRACTAAGRFSYIVAEIALKNSRAARAKVTAKTDETRIRPLKKQQVKTPPKRRTQHLNFLSHTSQSHHSKTPLC
jgi:hypothetical protein